MYNDELDYALESAYEDGYYQALYDMGYDDIADEDVDIFDDNYFDDAMESKADRRTAEYGAAGITDKHARLMREHPAARRRLQEYRAANRAGSTDTSANRHVGNYETRINRHNSIQNNGPTTIYNRKTKSQRDRAARAAVIAGNQSIKGIRSSGLALDANYTPDADEQRRVGNMYHQAIHAADRARMAK